MKYLLVLFIVFASGNWTDPAKIARVNELKKKAKTAYMEGDYKTALSHYHYLTDSLQVEDDNITLNMANAYYQLNDSSAVNQYQALTSSSDPKVRSVAEQQLGVMANKSKKYKEALTHFKQALKADPTNEEARYNYELLKKVLEEQKQNQDKNQDNKDNKDGEKDQENKDEKQQDQQQGDNKEQQNKDGEKKEDQQEKSEKQQDQKDKEGEKKEDEQKQDGKKTEEQKKEDAEKKEQQQSGEEQKSEEQKKKEQQQAISQKLKEMKISEEKAKMILEAMKNNEIQYIQQNRKKAKQRPDNSKPDW